MEWAARLGGDVGRVDRRVPVGAGVPPAEIVADEHDDVRARLGWGLGGG
jgi:hypothetical protein